MGTDFDVDVGGCLMNFTISVNGARFGPFDLEAMTGKTGGNGAAVDTAAEQPIE